MRRLVFALIYICLTPETAHADAREAFTALNNCLLSKTPSTCRSMLTGSSLPLYDRISSYDVMDCLPQKTDYIAEEKKDGHVWVRAQTTLGEKTRLLRVAFTKEKGTLKLDIPASLARAIGPKWEKQVNAVEAVYLMLKAQLGGKLNCATVQGLAGGNQKQ